MPFDGTGTYTPPGPHYPAVSGTAILASARNAIDADLASALTNCMTRDGQSAATGNQNFGGKNLINAGTISCVTLNGTTFTATGTVTGANVTATGTLTGTTCNLTGTSSALIMAAGSFLQAGQYIDLHHSTNAALNYSARIEVGAAGGLGAGTLNLRATGGTIADGSLQTSGHEVRAGLGAAGEKRLRLTHDLRDVYFSLNNASTTVSLWDITGALNRWSSDSAGNFAATGNVTAFSDERVKYAWKKLPLDFITKLAKIKSGTYSRKDVPLRQVGVSAQSLQELLPEAVCDNPTGLSVAYGNAALVAAIELAKEVLLLKKRLARLEAAR